MGRNAGGVINITRGGGSGNAKIVITAIENSRSIDSIKDRSVVKELARGISRFESVLGIREREIRIADLSGMNALGVTWVSRKDGKSAGILLNEKFFDRKKKDIIADVKKDHYDSGFKNRTNAPLQHTITHELAHATWNAGMTTNAAKGAKREIKALYQSWLKDGRKKGYGTYGTKNVSEFYSEAITKAIHGTSDKYTKKLIKITRKYGL